MLVAGSGQVQSDENPILKATIEAYRDCLRTTDNQLRTGQVAPERYAMAIEGACLSQYEAATRQMKEHLEAMPHGGVSYEFAQETTAKTMASIQSSDDRLRKQFLSAYVLWYASAARPQGKAAR